MNSKLIKNDFFDAVNKEWLDKTEIPSDRSAYGSFIILDIELEKLLNNLSNDWATGKEELPSDQRIHEYVKFYRMLTDWEKREALGMNPLKPIIETIESLKSFAEVDQNYIELAKKLRSMPYEIYSYSDFEDSSVNVLWLGIPGIILPDKKDYANEKKKEELLGKYQEVATKLLVKYGKSEAEASKIVANALKFDALLVEAQLSSEERAIVKNYYNPYTLDQVTEQFGFRVAKIAKHLTKKDLQKVILGNPYIFDQFPKIFNEKNFEIYRDYLIVDNIFANAQYLDEDTRILAGEYSRYISGVKEAKPKEKAAYLTAMSFFKMPIGLYYGLTYFGPKAKADVEKMIQNMIQVYQERLEKNTFLSPETIKKAILKLNSLNVMIGYPEEIESYYDQYKTKTFEENGSIIDNVLSFSAISHEYNLAKCGEKVNKKIWSMTPAMVNAYYSPTTNSIVFPAGILQKPFYSLEQSSSANFGGIGTVIAHEISHGFDNNGALFDEKGNMKNWWTEEDFAKFKEKTQAMIDLFDGEEIEAGKCNGKLTVSENIADAGGFACALEAAKREKDYNPRKFFENYAEIWKLKYTEKTAKLLLQTDVHAPVKLRTNIQLKNNLDFQKEYEISEGDKMYLAPEKMVKIW